MASQVSELSELSELNKLIWATAIAACGYLAKSVIELWIRWQRSRNEKLARLTRLSSLLDASEVAYVIQSGHRNKLSSKLEARHAVKAVGYEDKFAQMFAELNAEEKTLHDLIRGITVHTLRPINLALSKWLEEDSDFRTGFALNADPEVSRQLNLLARHLALWHAKYEIWIPEHPEHALVYMDDEKKHGLGFPRLVRGVVEQAINRHSRRLFRAFGTNG